eukprot:TRINITY_DN5241_c0_g1_i1.p1 TRINITY_DN5241_c0_g1~~TRINITY_DN5241_c0_g1_i1.p1  ORF type:complete len:128 (-),score=8.72 TRINITY_DN5241_c0_g1_i1:176-559(-)
MQSNVSSAGRPLEQSPRSSVCSKCGRFTDEEFMQLGIETPMSAPQVGKLFAERVQARGQTVRFACDYLHNALKEIDDRSSSSVSVLKLHSSLDSKRQLTLTTCGISRDHDTKTLNYSTVRDLQRLDT